MTSPRRVHIAAQYNGEDPHEIWHRDHLPSINTRESFETAARVAREGLYDFYFQAETSAISDTDGRIDEPIVVGRVDNVVAQSYLAATLDSVGFVSTINTTNNNPYDVARRLHTLDQISGGRAGWNLVLGGNPRAYRSYRNIGDRDAINRYAFGAEFVDIVRAYTGGRAELDADGAFHLTGDYFDVHARPLHPATRQGSPFVIQSGDSVTGRDFGARRADGIYTHYANEQHGTAFYRDIHERVARAGRRADEVKIFGRLAVLVAETDADAEELQNDLVGVQLHPGQLRSQLEKVWNVPLPDLDPDGPLPAFDPPAGAVARLGLSIGLYLDGPAQDAVDLLRRIQAKTGYGARRTLIEASGTDLIAGGADTVAAELSRLVQIRAVDGFVITPHVTGSWLEDFNRLVIPRLQDRGVYPTDYRDETLTERVLGS